MSGILGTMPAARLPPSLPTRDGVGPSCVGLPAGQWSTITDFLVQRFPAITRQTWIERRRRGDVVDERGDAVTPQRPYQPHIRVYYYRALDTEAAIPFDEQVLYRDAHLVVADKPHFLPVTPSGRYLQQTLLVRLKRRLGLDTLAPIHRIDRETAGLVLFSVQPHTRGAYADLFRRQGFNKQYEAIAPYLPSLEFPLTRRSRIEAGTPFFRLHEVPGLPNTLTHIELLDHRKGLAHYRLTPLTGRKHQLRVHMAALGIPIMDDAFYPDIRQGPDEPDDLQRPLQLLARTIAFTDPVTGEPRQFESAQRLHLP
ncbi:MAG: pseudouridine synthase [Burkholderiaceae bacterium]|nr:pseudouridine synthase [Burkholderiaceae bacterium]